MTGFVNAWSYWITAWAGNAAIVAAWLSVVQVLTTVLKFVPLLFMATVGLLFIKSANVGAFNAGGGSVLGAISAAGGNALLERGEKPDAAVQHHHVRSAAQSLASLTADHHLIVCHGNGPQVGLLAQESGWRVGRCCPA